MNNRDLTKNRGEWLFGVYGELQTYLGSKAWCETCDQM